MCRWCGFFGLSGRRAGDGGCVHGRRLAYFGMLAGLLLTLTTPEIASAWDAMLTCRFEEEIGFTIEGERVVHHRELFGPNEVIFAGLDSSTPTIKGDAGETRLVVVRRDSDTVWLWSSLHSVASTSTRSFGTSGVSSGPSSTGRRRWMWPS